MIHHFSASKYVLRLALIVSVLLLVSLYSMAQKVQVGQQKNYTLLGLGDSITEGGKDFSSYLYPLWEKLFVAGYQVEFIGPNQAQTSIGGIAHAGYSGKNAEFLGENIDSIYSKYPADIVLLHAGHNHFAEEKPIEGIIAAQKSIVEKIKLINPDARILLATVVESGKLPKYSYIPELNSGLEQLVSELRKSYDGIYLVDQSRKFDWQEDTIADMVHPNDSGAKKMAGVWFEKLQKVLDKPSEAFNPKIVSYKNTDRETLKLHIFENSKEFKNEKRACIVYFFGGGWKVGTALQFYREAAYFASKGIVAITADYRTEFDNGTTVFESVSDAKSAIRWIRANADKYGIDPDRIAAAGASAGGHLAAATGTIARFEESNEDHTISSKSNLNLLYYPVLDNGPDGYGSTEMKTRYKEISPLHNVNVDTPPTLILLGTEDPYLSERKAEEYMNALQNFGIDGELKMYQGAAHPIFLYRKGYSATYFQMLQDSEDFLERHGYMKGL
ncbi:acetyl esterase/lipase [Algoriphagus ratkowskyi]|uniref:Acetyl esterase/lipase n=1 Tax=Algoriphagus ratkowskyi TaxID=57028 RepID=A0A2W7R4V4_9BACT|nr:alpha/beta hydrolase fold domain-containing protein [Algoriphagus ratkowskyi]PZX55524.1 acetyl esterase/lipase [Algoriphagus ratkowskyi]TXD79564.1 prolyl oligopeptidase family serine peptidase [Algoriphagus ratkowskyi]